MPGTDPEILQALDFLKAGGFAVGPEWEKAHHIAQTDEGDPDHDWLHALCHRIEGDEGNADYWYRRAGRPRRHADIEAEWAHIRETLSESSD